MPVPAGLKLCVGAPTEELPPQPHTAIRQRRKDPKTGTDGQGWGFFSAFSPRLLENGHGAILSPASSCSKPFISKGTSYLRDRGQLSAAISRWEGSEGRRSCCVSRRVGTTIAPYISGAHMSKSITFNSLIPSKKHTPGLQPNLALTLLRKD